MFYLLLALAFANSFALYNQYDCIVESHEIVKHTCKDCSGHGACETWNCYTGHVYNTYGINHTTCVMKVRKDSTRKKVLEAYLDNEYPQNSTNICFVKDSKPLKCYTNGAIKTVLQYGQIGFVVLVSCMYLFV